MSHCTYISGEEAREIVGIALGEKIKVTHLTREARFLVAFLPLNDPPDMEGGINQPYTRKEVALKSVALDDWKGLRIGWIKLHDYTSIGITPIMARLGVPNSHVVNHRVKGTP